MRDLSETMSRQVRLMLIIVCSLGAPFLCGNVAAADDPWCASVPVLFGKKDGTGRRYEIDRPEIRKLREDDFNNKASSISVPAGWVVTLFQKKEFGGYSREFSVEGSEAGCRLFNLKEFPLDPDAGSKTWKDRTSSVKASRL